MRTGWDRTGKRRPRLLLLAALTTAATMLATAGCGDENDAESDTATATDPPVATATASAPGADQRATLSGRLLLDGFPLQADFLGVRVVRDGLTAACQNTIPEVVDGRYETSVASDAEVRGCGAPGAELFLWTFVDDTYLFSNKTLPWPGSAAPATFDATFSSATPEGASTPVTEFKGNLFDRDANPLPSGTVVEAYAGDVLCGVTSLRYGDDVERLYTLIVAGPEAVPGCAKGATLSFRLDGVPAQPTAINDLGAGGNQDGELDLTAQ